MEVSFSCGSSANPEFQRKIQHPAVLQTSAASSVILHFAIYDKGIISSVFWGFYSGKQMQIVMFLRRLHLRYTYVRIYQDASIFNNFS